VHVDDLVLLACVIQDTFGGGCLARIDVRNDADVAVKTEFFLPGHDLFFSGKKLRGAHYEAEWGFFVKKAVTRQAKKGFFFRWRL